MLNRWQRTIVDLRGNVVPYAQLQIRVESTQATATIYADRAGNELIPNGIVTADANGYAFFYAEADLYRISSAEPTIDWRYVDIGAAGALQRGNNLSDVTNPATARNNLGLKGAATRDVVSSPTDTSGGNKLVTQGWMGLGKTASVDSTIDADDLMSTGFFGNYASEQVLNIMNSGSSDYQAQLWLPTVGYSLKYRYRTPTGWRDKVTLHHTGNIRQSTGNSTYFPMSQNAVTTAINGVSDRRDKAEIKDLEVGLSLIKNLKPKLYKLNLRSWYRDQEATVEEVTTDPDTGEETTNVSTDPDVLAKLLSEYDNNDGSLAKDKSYTGFIAQDLALTLKELGLDDLGLVKNYQDEYGGDDRYYIEHEGLLAFMVKAIQEQQEQIEKLQFKVEQLEGFPDDIDWPDNPLEDSDAD